MVDLLEEDFDSRDLLPIWATQEWHRIFWCSALNYNGLWPQCFHELIKKRIFYDYISKSLRLHNYTVEWFWINKIKQQDKQRSNKEIMILQIFKVWDLSLEDNVCTLRTL